MSLLIAALLQVGDWEQLDGTRKPVPCPAATVQADTTATVRLPAGCVVHHPRVGYTVQQDQSARTELIQLRDKTKDLVDALNQEREISASKTSKFYAFEAEMKKSLDAANAATAAARREARAAESLVGKVAAWAAAGGIVVGVSVYALVAAKF